MTASPHEPHLGLVVEGSGDAAAVPALLRNFLQSELGSGAVYRDCLGKPLMCHSKNNALRPGGVEKFVRVAAARPGCSGVLVLLDGDEEAVCRQGPELLERAQEVTGKPVVVCLAEPMYEAWLVSSWEALKLREEWNGQRNPKEFLKDELRARGEAYATVRHQADLTHQIDLERAASRSPSLQRLFTKVDGMIRELGLAEPSE